MRLNTWITEKPFCIKIFYKKNQITSTSCTNKKWAPDPTASQQVKDRPQN